MDISGYSSIDCSERPDHKPSGLLWGQDEEYEDLGWEEISIYYERGVYWGKLPW